MPEGSVILFYGFSLALKFATKLFSRKFYPVGREYPEEAGREDGRLRFHSVFFSSGSKVGFLLDKHKHVVVLRSLLWLFLKASNEVTSFIHLAKRYQNWLPVTIHPVYAKKYKNYLGLFFLTSI